MNSNTTIADYERVDRLVAQAKEATKRLYEVTQAVGDYELADHLGEALDALCGAADVLEDRQAARA